MLFNPNGLLLLNGMNCAPISRYYKFIYRSLIGNITVYGDEMENIVRLRLETQKHFDDENAFKAAKIARLKVFDLAEKWLDCYFKGEKPETKELPLKITGSEFRQTVWQILREIPYGSYTTYGAIAREIALRRNMPAMSARSIGDAVARNPVLIIIPCHRVIGSNGKLTGYAGGTDIKRKLLELEGITIGKSYVFP